MQRTFAWGKEHGAWDITVRVSGHVLAHHGAMPYALCKSPPNLTIIASVNTNH